MLNTVTVRLVAASLLMLLPGPARGQQVGVTLFDPATGPNGVLSVHTSRPLGHLQIYGGLTTHYANDELVAMSGAGTVARALHHRAVSELALSVGLFSRLDLSLSLPLVLRQTSDHFPAGQSGGESGLGDLRFSVKVRALSWRGLGLAALLEATAPTASGDRLMGESSWTFTPRLVLDWRHSGGAVVAFNVGYRVREGVNIDTLPVDDELRLGLGAELPLGAFGLSLLGEVVAVVGLGDKPTDPRFPSESTVPVEALGALRWRHRSGFVLTGGMGSGLTSGYGAPDVRALLAVGFTLGESRGHLRQATADPQNDTQPAEPGKRPPPKKAPVARPPAPALVTLTAAAFDQAAAADPDPDGDGIPSSADRCPRQPEDLDGFQDKDGCPELDNDSDGVPDADDQCPLKKEVVNGVKDDDGCPDEGKARVAIKAGKVEISERVFFATGSDQLKPVSHDILRQVAGVLKANWQVRKVLVEGHTDNRGDKEMNVDLSERRARRVKAFIVARGVASHRLSCKGYGPTSPVASNRRRKGRAKNRRVAFTILKVATTRPAGGAP